MTSHLVRAYHRQQRLRAKPTRFLLRLDVDARWIAYPETRATARRVWFAVNGRERSVSREELRRDGCAWSSAVRDLLYSETGARRIFGESWQSPGRRRASPAAAAGARSAFGLGAEATQADIRKAFRRLAFELHPDRLRDDGSAFKALHAAYIAALAAAPLI
jgi:hypothetical protein